jgi:signal transduction histidine kinase
MSVAGPKNWVQIERRHWMYWLVALAMIIALSITVYLLYTRMVHDLADASRSRWVESGYYTGIGLVGLIGVFVLHTLHRQIELSGLRKTLKREEAELEDLRSRLTEISNLFEVATNLNLRLPVDSILSIMVRRVVDALKAQQASVMLFNPELEMLETRAFYGVEGEYTSAGKVKMGEGIAGKVAETREALLLSDTTPRPELKKHYKPHRNITSALSIPLVVENRCVGVLNINRINHPNLFNESQREIVRMFAEHIGAVIERAEELDRLAERTQDLELANAKLTEMNKMKEMFLSTASHELKTPLTSVIGYAEILNDHGTGLEEKQRKEFTRRLQIEAEHLLGLIEDILDLTRLETGKIELKRRAISLNEVTRTAVETARSLARKTGVVLVENYDRGVGNTEIDEVKIRQALVNLIVNAIKYSPENGEVRVETRLLADDLLVEVSDSGPGIRPEDNSQIFALFGQALRPATKGTSGLGIGLHLVKRIIELHGGSVGVDSHPHEGSKFWIRIPRETASSDIQAA